ncbi:MAG TPA: SGNH/GDSL hydrolase family protein [Candidatus Saccharimonadales bacterium]|nr:SGNH/GDSL hydrolase family protein [Candidatus Saccharimonadales bacterium]
MAQRLPTPGGDDDTWGTVLNNFLEVEHAADGTLKLRTDGTLSALYTKPAGGIPATDLSAAAQTNLASAATAVQLSAYGQQQLATQRAQALQRWFTALANRHYGRCNVVCLGDSITEGQGATQETRRWLQRLRASLVARFPATGVTTSGRGFLGANSSGEFSFTWPSTIAGSPTAGFTGGPKSQFVQFSGAGQSITYNLVGDMADIMWMQVPFGGSFSWQVDGGSTSTVSTNGGSILDGQITHISLGSAGAHTLTLAWVSGQCNIEGVVEYNGDYGAGIQVHDAAHYGWQASNWVSVTANGSSGPAQAISNLNPSLIIITLGVNDQWNGVVPATFQTNLTTLISQLRAVLATPHPAIVLNMMPPRQGQSGYTYPWAQYVNAAWNIAGADTDGPGGTSLVTVMDFTLGPRAEGADTNTYGTWALGDLVHPSDKGHSLFADYLTTFLTPS